LHPSYQPSASTPITTFFVTGGIFEGADRIGLEKRLETLPTSDGEWLFHLGDFNNVSLHDCPASTYTDFSNLFNHSSVPVYLLPGDSEWNNCANPTSAWENWVTYLSKYDAQHWNNALDHTVKRDTHNAGNFAFLHRKVQYIGINLVGGIVHNQTEREKRHEGTLRWVEEEVARNVDDIELVVIVGNAEPSDDNGDFFKPLFTADDRWGKKLLYIHESNERSQLRRHFDGNKHILMLGVEVGLWPPLQVQIDVMKGGLKVDRGEWYTEPPSKSPTPSISPSKVRSSYPSMMPTQVPTKPPSPEPTKFPSKGPTQRPTPKPTPWPFWAPKPTPRPTPRPTPSPTKSSAPGFFEWFVDLFRW